MAENKETQDKEATVNVASDNNIQAVTAENPSKKNVDPVADKTLEELSGYVSEFDSLEELDAIEAAEKEGKDRTGAYEIIEKRRNEIQEKAASEEKAKSAPKKSNQPKKIKVKILCHNASGKYLLPYNYGQTAKLEAKQAEEMIKAKDAEEVK